MKIGQNLHPPKHPLGTAPQNTPLEFHYLKTLEKQSFCREITDGDLNSIVDTKQPKKKSKHVFLKTTRNILKRQQSSTKTSHKSILYIFLSKTHNKRKI